QPSGKNIIRWLLKKRTNGSVRYCQYTSVVFFTWGFEWLIFKFNVNLEPHDQGDIGPTIGTATLAVYLVYAFHFLSENPEALNLKLLTNSGFIYSTTLLLFSLECMKLRRLKQK
ncbi:hypothetical protein, partial [Escherichia coli]